MDIRKSVSTLASAALLSGLLALPAFSQAPAPVNPPGNYQPAPGQHEHRERHPEIRRAMKHLRQTKMNLEKGAHDFGGHRAHALQLVDQAIQQLQQAMQDDKH